MEGSNGVLICLKFTCKGALSSSGIDPTLLECEKCFQLYRVRVLLEPVEKRVNLLEERKDAG